ncbi:MAG TPA: AmmeMemoRadiSam system protein B [Vicinamibacterales bacterium]|nr:AmmeMemoRadiSam system protein B [Vicinamibacterales bacterium]
MVRRAAVAGTWYPGSARALAGELDVYLDRATGLDGDLVALIAPHAGLRYSGPVAARSYRLLRDRPIDLVVLVGPSHFAGFDGVAVHPGDGFETPLGTSPIDREAVAALVDAEPAIVRDASVHEREHSLEMQLPFIQHVSPGAAIVPLLVGFQTADTASVLADALVRVFAGRPRTVLVASSDLSHYHDAATASRLDGVVLDCLARFDADALQQALDRNPGHACGGGPMVAVLRAAARLGARDARVLAHADSGDVSGDKRAVVGYAAAAFGRFADQDTGR